MALSVTHRLTYHPIPALIPLTPSFMVISPVPGDRSRQQHQAASSGSIKLLRSDAQSKQIKQIKTEESLKGTHWQLEKRLRELN